MAEETVRWSGVPTTYTVKYNDGSESTVRVKIMDAKRWEDNHGGKSLLAGQTLTAMLQCIWYALRREGLTDVKNFDVWAEDLDDFGQVTDDTTEAQLPDPTSPEASGD